MLWATESPTTITRTGSACPGGATAGAVGGGPRSAAATSDSGAAAPPVVATNATASRPAVAGVVMRTGQPSQRAAPDRTLDEVEGRGRNREGGREAARRGAARRPGPCAAR